MEHYKTRPTETIDAIRTALTEEEFRGYCIGNVMKYALRYQHKGGDDDLAKAAHYLSFMMDKKAPEVDLSEAQGLWDRIRRSA